MERRKFELPRGGENPTGLDCGDKFRAMLKCIERDAAIPPCTHLVNIFLACEHAVFRSALNAQPPQASGSVQSKKIQTRDISNGQTDYSNARDESLSTTPSDKSIENNAGTDSQNSVNDLSESEVVNGLPPPQRPTSEWLLLPSQSTLDFVQRAVEKQAHACTKLVHVAAKPDYPQKLTSFCKRIAEDVHLSFSLVAQKVVTIVRSDRDPKD